MNKEIAKQIFKEGKKRFESKFGNLGVSTNGFPQIRFKNKKYFLINSSIFPLDGAIATKKQYLNCEPSYAHLFEDGKVKRFGKIIGTKNDIEFLDKEEQ